MTTTQAGAAVSVDDRASVARQDLQKVLHPVVPHRQLEAPPHSDECPRRPRRARERAPRRRQPRLLRSLGVGGDEAGFKIARQDT